MRALETWRLRSTEVRILPCPPVFLTMWYVYILQCNDGSLYTGITNDLQKRIDTHNDGSGSKYIRSRRPVKLVYKEEFSTKSEALKKEAKIKSFDKENKKALIKYGLRKFKRERRTVCI